MNRQYEIIGGTEFVCWIVWHCNSVSADNNWDAVLYAHACGYSD